MENVDTGTHSIKIGADSSAENTPLPHNLSAKFVCPSPKILDVNGKRLHWASVVRGPAYTHRRMLHLKCLECLANAS